MTNGVACLVCQEELETQFVVEGYPIGQCSNCGLFQVIDAVEPSKIVAQYDANYYLRDPARYKTVAQKHRVIWLRRLRQIELASRSHRADKRLLDIGCGTGAFLSLAQEQGWRVEGVEISREGARETGRLIGTDRVWASIHEVDGTERFDVVTMWAVLEHLSDPMGYLAKAHSLLKPGGVLALATVNTDAWNRRLFGRGWRYFAPPEHLVYFNLKNLKLAMSTSDFDLVHIETRFSEVAFWQSISRMIGMRLDTFPARIIRKGFVWPIGALARLNHTGDILEVLGRRK